MIDLETLEVNEVLLTSEKKCPQWDLMLIVFQRHQVAAACWALTQSQRQRGLPPPWCLAPVGPLGCPWQGLCCETPCRWSFLPLCLMCCSRWGIAGGPESRPAEKRRENLYKLLVPSQWMACRRAWFPVQGRQHAALPEVWPTGSYPPTVDCFHPKNLWVVFPFTEYLGLVATVGKSLPTNMQRDHYHNWRPISSSFKSRYELQL